MIRNARKTTGGLAPVTSAQIAATTRAAKLEAQRIKLYWRLPWFARMSRVKLLCYLKKHRWNTGLHTIRVSLPTLRILARRVECGLIIHGKCSIDELRSFCTARRIKFGSDDSKAKLCRRLYDADASPTFDKFMDLPPELRLLVFDFHFEWLAKYLNEDGIIREVYGPPPITRINKLLRKEALPVFQDRQVLNVIWDYQHYPGWPPFEVYNRHKMNTLQAPSLKTIRKIKLTLYYLQEFGRDDCGSASASFLITLNRAGNEVVVHPFESKYSEEMDEPIEMWRKTESAIRDSIVERIAMFGVFMMERQDLELIPKAYYQAMLETGMREAGENQ